MAVNDVEVLILSGGEGRRLRSMVSDVPKPMAPIGTKPFLDYLVRGVAAQGFTNICFLTGYKSEVIQTYFENNFKDLNKRFSVEQTPLGTGGAIFKAMKSSSLSKFLVLNGDTFFNVDLRNFVGSWEPQTLKIALKRIDDPSRYGRVEVSNQGQVLSFIEKGSSKPLTGNALINGGIYALDKSFLPLSKGDLDFLSLENEVFPLLLSQGKIFSQAFDGDFIDIGVPEDYIRAQTLIENWLSKIG